MKKYDKWVDIFGNAPSLTEWKPEQYAKNITLIYSVTVPFDADSCKLRFSNRYGSENVSIESLSICDNEKVLYKSNHSFEMKPGEDYITEEFSVSFYRMQQITVRFYLSDFTNMTSGVLTTGCLCKAECAEGDFTEIIEPDHNKTVATKWNYFLTDIFVRTEEKNHTAVCFGDSITAQDWPDYLYKLFLEADNNNTAVVRKAVSGTRLLRQYDCNKYRSYGIKGKTRFEHEIDVEGADILIIQHGINDIIHPVGFEVNEFRPMSDLPTAQEMIDVLSWYVNKSKEKGYKVYLGTLLPIQGWRTYADFREDLRCEVNEWIRNNNLSDGVIDFDKAVRSEDNPKSFREGFDSGDHLHPSVLAYKEMGRLANEELNK